MQIDKNPHNHYLEQSFAKTENIIFVIHAEQTLPNISFENIHKIKSIDNDHLNSDENLHESTIINIDTNKGFGFILSTDNLYFNYSDVDGEFEELQKNDVVQFIPGKNFEGRPRAKYVKKVSYSFEDPTSEIFRDKISHINHYKGLGFINNQPENLYFHQAFMTKPEDFENLKVGDDVEFLIGRNAEGEKIARLVRPITNPESTKISLN